METRNSLEYSTYKLYTQVADRLSKRVALRLYMGEDTNWLIDLSDDEEITNIFHAVQFSQASRDHLEAARKRLDDALPALSQNEGDVA